MSYLDYIIQFNRLRRQQPFSSASADLYYHLLWIANGLSWKNPFNEGSLIIQATLGMTDKTLATAREKLVQAGLLTYTAGKKGTFSTYELLTIPENNTENFRSIRGESGGENGGNAGEKTGTNRGQPGDLHKTKNKTKTKGANAPAANAKNSASKDSPPPAPTPPIEPEPWLAWMLANAPRVQQMKKPLTAGQWESLRADFGEGMVRDVLGQMENHADLHKKYTSANLTAREWCRRRCPGGKPPRPAPAAPASSAPDEPELNHAAIAEREAEREAELSAQRRQRRAQAAT